MRNSLRVFNNFKNLEKAVALFSLTKTYCCVSHRKALRCGVNHLVWFTSRVYCVYLMHSMSDCLYSVQGTCALARLACSCVSQLRCALCRAQQIPLISYAKWEITKVNSAFATESSAQWTMNLMLFCRALIMQMRSLYVYSLIICWVFHSDANSNEPAPFIFGPINWRIF